MTRPDDAKDSAPGLEVVNLTKRFGNFVALDGVSLKVAGGSFHALLGENGAGKSTLVKCVIGYQRASDGQVVYDGREVDFASPRDAHAAGIGMVYQHFTLVPNLSVAENLVLARDTVPKVVNWRREHAALDAFMREQPFAVPLRAKVRDLAAGQKQKLEILKQLYLGRRFLILDEPTSVLTADEADEVLGLLRDRTRTGDLTVLIITHKFREVNRFADAVSVLRRGTYVGGGTTGRLDEAAMARMMIGEVRLAEPAARVASPAAPPRLTVEGLEALDDAGAPAVRGLSLAVRPGEILGVAGVSGNGQPQLIEVLAGQRRPTAGRVAVNGVAYRGTRSQIREHRVHLLPETPLDNACGAGLSVADNLALRDFDRPPMRRRGGGVNRKAVLAHADRLIKAFGIKTPGATTPIRNLSGGNVQRAVLARELAEGAAVLVVANPCFGLDFAASADIRAKIMAARNGGAAVLLVSEDLDELLRLSDRLGVMFEGRLVYEAPTQEADVEAVGKAMAGGG